MRLECFKKIFFIFFRLLIKNVPLRQILET